MVHKNEQTRWKVEYDETLYKIYDWDKRLTGYFFPQYGDIEREDEDDIIEGLNKDNVEVTDGALLVPMLKLDLLDSDKAIAVDRVVFSLESCRDRAAKWNNWLQRNAGEFSINGAGVHTAREDRNMLSIALAVHGRFKLGDKNLKAFLSPLLDRLHSEGLL